MKPTIHLLKLKGYTIQEQLQIEEALLRNDQRNWCILQDGVPPSIVLGISGKPEKLVSTSNTLPLIKRYTGGGTVVVDDNTAFISFICQSDQLQTPCNPDSIFKWSEGFYKHVFKDLPFMLRERDYVFHDRKFGGNAQYLAKNRWVHHTTLLWDYNPSLMKNLLMPEKRPEYRLDRSHEEFLCTLKEHLPNKTALWQRLESALEILFEVVEVSESEILYLKEENHRRVTAVL